MIGRIRDALADRARRVRYFASDILYLLSLPFRGLGSAIGGAFSRVSSANRRRLGAAVAALATVALAVFVLVPNLPCAFPGGDACAPEDEAMAIVPADALAYVHVNVDEESEQFTQAASVAGRTPQLSEQILLRALPFLLGASGQTPDFGEEIEPWFGGEMAVAVVPGASGTQQVQLLEVSDTKGAREYEEAIAAGSPEPDEYRGVEVREDERGLATAIVGDFLAIGTAGGVRSVIDVSGGSEGPDARGSEDAARDAMDELPAERFAEAYLSTEGIDSFLALSEGALAPFEPLVDSGDSQAAAFALSADDAGFRISSRSLLDPERDPEGGGFFSAFDPFEPQLPADLQEDTLAYAGFGNADATVSSLLDQATIRTPGIATGFTDLVERLRKDAGVDLTEELLPALNGEGAIAVAPKPGEDTVETTDAQDGEVPEGLDPPETLSARPNVPYLEFLADDVDAEAARESLASLQGELAKSVDPNIAKPIFREEDFGDVTGQVLERGPGDVIAYAVAGTKLAIANDTAPIERLGADPDSSLGGSDVFESALEGLPEDPLFLVYLDLAGLITLAEQLGAGAEGPFVAFAEDLRRLQTFGLSISREEDLLATDSLLRIAEP
jgi:hypothetical protein